MSSERGIIQISHIVLHYDLANERKIPLAKTYLTKTANSLDFFYPSSFNTIQPFNIAVTRHAAPITISVKEYRK